MRSACLCDIAITFARENPSNYCLFVMSEGAEWEGYRLREFGEADAYGHRKKANVAEDLSDEIKKRTGEETVVSDLTYDLRSGNPDFTDRLVATTFGTIALNAAREGRSGLMTAIVNGCYALVEIPDPKLGPRNPRRWMSRRCTIRNDCVPTTAIRWVCQFS